MTIREAKKIHLDSPSAALDISCFLEEITGFSKTALLLNERTELSDSQENTFLKYCQMRNKGLPVAYILHKKDFFARTFYVDENVLIPKPDTEILVERSIAILKEKFSMEKISAADVCTGSGCIGVSVILERGDNFDQLVMTDISTLALDIAKKNAEALVLDKNLFDKITFHKGDLLEGLGNFHMILSNPPYVPRLLAEELLKDGRNEPLLALDGDVTHTSTDGLALPKRLIDQILSHLIPGGVFLMELGEYNIEKARDYAMEKGFNNLSIHKDLEGQLRVLEGWLF